MISACEYLAQVGYTWLLGSPHQPADEDDADAIAEARQRDHDLVIERLLETKAEARVYESRGVNWICEVTWPDRVPGLITWSGQQTLPKLIAARQAAASESLGFEDQARNPLTLTAALSGASGLDPQACVDAIDAGFSISKLGVLIVQRPALELLAVLGLEQVPLVSFAARSCAFVHNGTLWRFDVHAREGGYYHRWGELRAADWSPERKRWAEMDHSLASHGATL